MNKTKAMTAKILAYALCATALMAPCQASWAHASHPEKSILTLEHLRNGNYQIPDLACGYTNVELKNGKGETGGVKVVFGRAAFGYKSKDKQLFAAVHLSYFTDELGWLQEIVLVKPQQGKLVQVAEYALDDRQELKDLSIVNGQVEVDTQSTVEKAHARQLTRIDMADSKLGCVLQVSQFNKDENGKLKATTDLTPYLSTIEDRIGRCWSPTNKDRGEHVEVAFTINPSGEVIDIRVNESSEVATADEAATEAVLQAAPFPPLPQKSGEPLSVCLDFEAGVTIKQ